jgi:hypothetical protein
MVMITTTTATVMMVMMFTFIIEHAITETSPSIPVILLAEHRQGEAHT